MPSVEELIGGRYRLKRPLARGGMGEVWEATHELTRSPVALKFLRADLVEDAGLVASSLERFRFEAQLSARLAPVTRHVVAVSDAGVHGAQPYMVMELVRGGSLADVLAAQGPLKPAQLLPLLRQVGAALAAVHRLGVVHRDLKPSNILLSSTPDGIVVKLCDFGVAKATGPAPGFDLPRATAEGALVGSPGYMSPEQIAGKGMGPASDQWSLAAVAYEALTGRPCVQGATPAAVLLATLNGKHMPLRAAAPRLPRGLDAWAERALAVSPAARFTSIEEATRAFEAALGRATPRRAHLLAAGLVALLASIAALALRRELRGQRPPAEQPPAAAAAEIVPDERARADLRPDERGRSMESPTPATPPLRPAGPSGAAPPPPPASPATAPLPPAGPSGAASLPPSGGPATAPLPSAAPRAPAPARPAGKRVDPSDIQ